MRLVAATCVLSLAGCAQLAGIDEPVAAFPVPDNLDGDYLMAIAIETSSVTDQIELRVPVSVDPGIREIYFNEPQAIRKSPRGVIDENLGFFYGELANTDTFDFTVEWEIEIPSEATTNGTPFTIHGEVDGHFPIPDGGDTATTDAFCGTLDGDDIISATFGAFKIEPGTPPPGAFTCADLPI